MVDVEAGAPPTLSDEERNDIALLARELPAFQQQLQELDVLLQQQEQELESQRARAQSAADAVRKLESGGSYTREQYQQTVAQAHQGELRALTVQHQLEALRSRRDSVDQLIGFAEFALTLGRRIDPTAAAAPPRPAAPTPAPAAVSAPAPAPMPPPSEVAIIEAQEAERAWIAQQLHNGPAQSLTNLILRAEICQRLVDTNAGAAKSELTDLRQTIFQSLQGMRRFIFDVRPMILDDLGLYPALRRFVDDWHEQGHPSVALTLIGADRRYGRAVELTAFRIIQDAIKAPDGDVDGATAVQVLDEQGALKITLDAPGPRFETKGDGLPAAYHTIGQRAAIVGGSVGVESRPGVRSLKVTIPIGES